MAQLKPVAKKQVKAVENPAKNRNFKPPNLDEFLPKEKKTMVSYMEGAKYYSMNYYAFVKLAKEAGANIRIHMANIEIGDKAPSIDLLIVMAEFFGVTLDYLVLGR